MKLSEEAARGIEIEGRPPIGLKAIRVVVSGVLE